VASASDYLPSKGNAQNPDMGTHRIPVESAPSGEQKPPIRIENLDAGRPLAPITVTLSVSPILEAFRAWLTSRPATSISPKVTIKV